MQTRPVTPEQLRQSVIAVPPLARDECRRFSPDANRALIRHIEAGGVSTLLYGGNANFYHLPLSEYETILHFLAEAPASDTLCVPSIGPAYGRAMDQAKLLAQTDFPTAMLLPHQGLTTPDGVATGFRHLVEAMGRPGVIYLKHLRFLGVTQVRKLVEDGLVSWIKYAVVRDDPADDLLLRDLVDRVNPNLLVSGIGEQPAIAHRRDFGLSGFTAGCVCIAPALSQQMLGHINEENWDAAEAIRCRFKPLEDLRNAISPVRVLHEAVALAKIADTGPHLPFLSPLTEDQREAVQTAARNLMACH